MFERLENTRVRRFESKKDIGLKVLYNDDVGYDYGASYNSVEPNKAPSYHSKQDRPFTHKTDVKNAGSDDDARSANTIN